jgi:hypothetical protein
MRVAKKRQHSGHLMDDSDLLEILELFPFLLAAVAVVVIGVIYFWSYLQNTGLSYPSPF